MDISRAISNAKAKLNQPTNGTGLDPRWQAIIEIADYIDSSPEQIWQFIEDTRKDADDDLESALVTVLLEHLVERHEHIKSRAVSLAEADTQMKRMLEGCW